MTQNTKAEIVLDLPDGKTLFALKGAQIEALERACGKIGIRAILARMEDRQYGYNDLYQTIYWALQGGGKTPAEAQEMAEFYMRQPLAAGPTSPFSIAYSALYVLFEGFTELDAPPGEQTAGT